MKRRVLSALVLLPFVIVAVFAGGWAFNGLVITAIVLAAGEYVHIMHTTYTLSWGMIVAFEGLWVCDAISSADWLPPGLAGLLLLSAWWTLVRAQRGRLPQAPTAHWALEVGAGMYLGAGGAYLIQVRALPDGMWWMGSALLTVWLSDTAAYLVGKRWGRHKIASTISPGKSWEGYIAGVITGAISSTLIVSTLAFPYVTPLQGLGLGLVLAGLTPNGDFFVSLIKREVGVKDTSNLIPGHGGIFDRIDSLLWMGVLTYALVTLFING